MKPANVLVLSDDADFFRELMACWQTERRVPAITQASSDIGASAIVDHYELVIIGPVRQGALDSLLARGDLAAAVVCVSAGAKDSEKLRSEFPGVLWIPRQDAWIQTLMIVSGEALRRVEAQARARRAEQSAAACEREATLGRYVLERIHSVNDALTSLLGNADLLLQAPGPLSPQGREQIRTVRAMALRLGEIMQHFSSLAAEAGAAEKESQTETASLISPRS